MSLRVRAESPPSRPSGARPAKPAVFDMDVCESDLPDGAQDIVLDGRRLPAFKKEATRVLVLGDTGCRLVGVFSQPCNDPRGWPFAQVAATASRMAPDLVIHVGDYHYREAPCPPLNTGCTDSPWGYGWDAWRADFFAPAAPLLAAAPWVLLRGNHEECFRAGQGWFRLLAPEPYTARRSCDDPANDDIADFSEPYAVPMGAGQQVIVFDTARAGNVPLKRGDPKDDLTAATYLTQARQAAALAAANGIQSWFASHHPVLAFAANPRSPTGTPFPGNAPMQSALRDVSGDAYFQPGVQVTMHGHVHQFQAIEFASGQAAAIVAGHGGDNLDTPLPATDEQLKSPGPGAQVGHMTHSSSFGFLLMERDASAAQSWSITAFRPDGTELTRCRLVGKTLRCDATGRLD
jgi:hypothetical protein